MLIYSHLEDGLNAVANSNKYIFAADAEVGDHKFKKYIVACLAELYEYIDCHDISAYEVISRPNVYLYLDIEIKNIYDLDEACVSGTISQCCVSYFGTAFDQFMIGPICDVYESLRTNPLDDQEMAAVGNLISNITKRYVEIVFQKPTNIQKMDMHSACRISKLSFHFIHR